MEENNLKGAPVDNPYLEALSVPEFRELMDDGAQVVDVRNPAGFAGGHVPGSINIWQDGFAAFAGYFLNYEDPLVIVGEGHGLDPVRRSMIRIGYDNMAGYLAGGFQSWYMAGNEVSKLDALGVHELAERLDEFSLLDVRKITDRERFHIEGSSTSGSGISPGTLTVCLRGTFSSTVTLATSQPSLQAYCRDTGWMRPRSWGYNRLGEGGLPCGGGLACPLHGHGTILKDP